MTDKNKEIMKEIMKEMARRQIGCFTPGQNGWSEYVANCIAIGICPNCGDDLYFDQEAVDKDFERNSWGVPHCNREECTFPPLTPQATHEYDFTRHTSLQPLL